MAWLLANGDIGLHIPKTGGTWVREVLGNLQLIRVDTRSAHAPLPVFTAPHEQRAFKFAFIRHPLDWYVSWWRWHADFAWTRKFAEPILPACAFTPRLGFHEFVAQCLAQAPGMVSDLYELFVGAPEAPIDFIGRHESLRADLLKLLALRSLPYDVRIIDNTLRQQISQTSKPAWDPALRNAVAEAEARAMQRFGYTP